MRPALPRLLFLTFTITVMLASASAQTDSWLGGQGNWYTSLNWSDGVPVATSDVVIDAQNENNNVTLNANSTIHSLIMSSPHFHLNDLFVDRGQNFVITQQANIGFSSRLFMRSGGTMTFGTNLVEIGGVTVAENSTLQVPGNFNAFGNTDLNTGGTLTVGGTLFNTNTFLQESTAGTVTVTGQLANVSTQPGYYEATMQLAATTNVASLLNATGGIQVNGSLNVSGTLNNTDFIETILTGAVASTMTLQNSGSIDVYNGTTFQVGSGTRGSTTGYLQYSNGTLIEEIYYGGAVGGSAGHVTLYQGGAVFLDGTLNIQLLNGFIPRVGAFYTILTFDPGALSGSFANVENLYFNNGTEMWQVIYDNVDGRVALKAVATQ